MILRFNHILRGKILLWDCWLNWTDSGQTSTRRLSFWSKALSQSSLN